MTPNSNNGSANRLFFLGLIIAKAVTSLLDRHGVTCIEVRTMLTDM